MKVTGYAISCIYGDFRMARYERDVVVEDFKWSGTVESNSDFVNALRDARASIGIKGKGRVSIVHEHDLHTHTHFEIPRMDRRDLEKYLQRKVDQQTEGENELSWCYHEAKHGDGTESVLLHILPKKIVDTIFVACTSMGLTPKRFVPLTEIISNYLPKLGIDEQEMVLVVALFSNRAEIVVGMGDGEALFVRELSFGTSSKFHERLALDINRTVRYAQQQTGKTISQAWIIGDRPNDILTSLGDTPKIEIHLDEKSNDPIFWMNEAAHLPNSLSANFASALVQRNITRESIRRTGVWLTLLLLISAATLTASFNKKTTVAAATVGALTSENHHLGSQIDELDLMISMADQKRDRLANLQSNSFNMPGIFLLHLSKLTPTPLVLHDVEVISERTGWKVSIKGSSAHQFDSIHDALAEFEQALSTKPWNMNVTKSWRIEWYRQLKSGLLREGKTAPFEIVGLLQ
ncbi:MAG: hypothetical protein V3U65_16115 [Granulosicoccaceae bacterium]